MNNKICRLCLQTITGNYETIGESLENILKLNMDISKEAVKCIECTNNLEVFLKFKSASDYTLTADLKDDIKLDPEKIDITNNLIPPMESNNEIKCCFCTKTSGREGLTALNESKEHTFLVNVLREHIPKLNLNITEELLTCEICLDGLQSVSSFVTKCLDVEQKISNYTEIIGTDDKGQVELEDVQQYIANPTIKCETESGDENESSESCGQFEEEYTMKEEAEIKFEMEAEDPELFIKTEDIDIKSEDSDCNRFQEPPAIIKIDESLDSSMLKPQRRHKICVNQLELTYKNSEGITMYKCKICPYESKRKNDLRQHELRHKNSSDITMFKCNLCPYKTKRRSNLIQHKLTHKDASDITMFKCNLCPYKAKRRGHLEEHKLTHKDASELTMFKCKHCSHAAKRQSDLTRHELIHKSTSEVTIFKCELCPYETKRQDYLRQHELTHTRIHKSSSNLRMFKCEICSYISKRIDNLKRHELLHKSTSEKTMFKCEICSHESKRMSSQKRHNRLHKSSSDVTMFRCELCPYEAKRQKLLRMHKLTHKSTSDLTMCKCELCPYESKRIVHLKRHKLTHKSTNVLT